MEIKYTYENKVFALMVNSLWINLISLFSMYLSLERLFARDWLIIVMYISGSVLGKWVAMTQSEKYVALINKKIHRVFRLSKIFINRKYHKR